MTQFDHLSRSNVDPSVSHALNSQRSEEASRTQCENGILKTEIAQRIGGIQPEDGKTLTEGIGALGITYDLSYVFPEFSFEEPRRKRYNIIWDGNDMGTVTATSKHRALDVLAFELGWDCMEQLRYSEIPVLERAHFYSQFSFA